MPQEPQTEIIVRDWQPGQEYHLAFVRPGDWRQSRQHLPPHAFIVKVAPGSAAAETPPTDPDPPDKPKPPSDPEPPAPPPPPQTATELLIYSFTGVVTKAHRGFPWDQPPRSEANGDWTRPPNFAEGTIHLRAEIIKMPSPQTVKLQLCHWQDNNQLETCSDLGKLVYQGRPVVLEWSQAIPQMWKKDNKPLDWTRPRARCGLAIKNAGNRPVSGYSGWNWNGEDPDEWYPMDLKFRAVVVAKGAKFSGWDRYIK